MQLGMVTLGSKDDQIPWLVIAPVLIQMMDHLAGTQSPTQHLLRHDTVLMPSAPLDV